MFDVFFVIYVSKLILLGFLLVIGQKATLEDVSLDVFHYFLTFNRKNEQLLFPVSFNKSNALFVSPIL